METFKSNLPFWHLVTLPKSISILKRYALKQLSMTSYMRTMQTNIVEFTMNRKIVIVLNKDWIHLGSRTVKLAYRWITYSQNTRKVIFFPYRYCVNLMISVLLHSVTLQHRNSYGVTVRGPRYKGRKCRAAVKEVARKVMQ